MDEKRVVFVVGHENWGKSLTLRALEEMCPRQGRKVMIEGTEFFIRKTSNDDVPESYAAFMRSTHRPNLIAALCPKFKNLANYNLPAKTVDGFLQSLSQRAIVSSFG